MRPVPIIAALVAVLCVSTLVAVQRAVAQPPPTSAPATVKSAVQPAAPVMKAASVAVVEQPKLVAAPVTTATADPGVQGLWGKIKKAAKDHRYRELVALILTALMFIWRRFAFGFVMHRLSSKQIAWVTVVIAFLGTIPAQLMAANFSWGTFIWDGLVASGEAMLLWQAVLKHLPWFKVPDPVQPATKPAGPPAPVAT